MCVCVFRTMINDCVHFQDWSDLIEYVINTFVKKPQNLQLTQYFRLDTESFDDDKVLKDLIGNEDPKVVEDTTPDQVMLDAEDTDK